MTLVLAIPLVASACGDDGDRDDDDELTAVVEVDISDIPEESVGDSVAALVDIVERRVEDLGGSHFDATITDQTTISFEFAELDLTTAQGLFKGGLLEFMEPTLDEKGDIVCRAADGSEFRVDRANVTEGVNAAGQKEAQCISSAGETGAVLWKPALGRDSTGETRELTGRYLKPDSAEVVSGTGQCLPACVMLEFNNQGALLFEQITTRLINYPLGIFLDDQLTGAPNVQSVISTGQTIITGLSAEEADTLRAQVNSGALPLPVSLVSIRPTA